MTAVPPEAAIRAAADDFVALLRCPVSGETLRREGNALVAASGRRRYPVDEAGIPRFAGEFCSPEAEIQQRHYDTIAAAYVENLGYPHTQEYIGYLDRALEGVIGGRPIGTAAEICCGAGEAFPLLGSRVARGVGVDISAAMLSVARRKNPDPRFSFVQGDATRLPLADSSFDTVFMLGGIHHVNDRAALFAEIDRILKPGGRFIWREPVSDFILWRALRAIVYRVSPILDHATERPLLFRETAPVLEKAKLRLVEWRTFGFFAFCLFMNSDVLYFNRLFRFVPGIRSITRAAIALDDAMRRVPGLRRAGLIVVGSAEKPA
jgi:SAM-dependent methyltransferase